MGGKLHSDIAYIESSWNYWISFRSVITDNLAMEGFKAEELVRSITLVIIDSEIPM